MTAVEPSRHGIGRDPGAASPFVPPLPPSRYERPRAHIRPEQDLTWFRRAWPLVAAHKWLLGSSLAGTFGALIIQVVVPLVVMQTIDVALVDRAAPLRGYIVLLAVLAVLRGAFNYVGRLNLFRSAYRFEYELRNIVYDHLSTMSFSFYDRVQSGYIISRANSDIRAVQLYLAFAPSILLQCGVA